VADSKTDDPKVALSQIVSKRATIFTKLDGKAAKDPKRRLALKRLKRAQRRLQKTQFAEKKAAEGAKKAS